MCCHTSLNKGSGFETLSAITTLLAFWEPRLFCRQATCFLQWLPALFAYLWGLLRCVSLAAVAVYPHAGVVSSYLGPTCSRRHPFHGEALSLIMGAT